MIMADSFVHSAHARHLEYQQCPQDTPTIIQFAAHTPHEFGTAAQLVAPFVDGIDLNCGCPQGWAVEEGIGAGLMRDPELVRRMVREAVGRLPGDAPPISVKMRIFHDAGRTVELARILEAAGAAWLTVHGRTRKQKSSEPVDYAMIRLVREAVNIPVIANGDVASLADAERIAAQTGVRAVMAARGLLENPALFAGHPSTPWACVERFIQHSVELGTASPILHHHLARMMSPALLTPAQHRHLNSLSNASVPTLLEFVAEARATGENPPSS